MTIVAIKNKMPMDVVYPCYKKPKSCVYVVQARPSGVEWPERLSYQQIDLMNNCWMFDELEAALFALDQLSSMRGQDVPIGWRYQLRRVEKNTMTDPQNVMLVSWKRLPDTEGQQCGTTTGKVTFHGGLKSC